MTAVCSVFMIRILEHWFFSFLEFPHHTKITTKYSILTAERNKSRRSGPLNFDDAYLPIYARDDHKNHTSRRINIIIM